MRIFVRQAGGVNVCVFLRQNAAYIRIKFQKGHFSKAHSSSFIESEGVCNFKLSFLASIILSLPNE